MCIVCCKEFKGWCKSFTRTEAYLSVLQLLFLVVLIASLTFVILHFLACSSEIITSKNEEIVETTSQSSITEDEEVSDVSLTGRDVTITPLPKGIKCTWKPSAKTTAVTHYYDMDLVATTILRYEVTNNDLTPSPTSWEEAADDQTDNLYDGKEANEVKKGYLLALVKMKSPQDIKFGCTLTIVAQSWTLTAASCIEAIEKADTLDAFVMIRSFDEQSEGGVHTVADVSIHPQYRGVNGSYDLAALKSEDPLVNDIAQIVTLPTMLDYLSITIGERLSILGYGRCRNFDKDPRSRGVREAGAYGLPARRCGGGAGARCAGGQRARAAPCAWCGGAALLRGRALLGVAAAAPPGRRACRPARYVELAARRDWLDSVISSD